MRICVIFNPVAKGDKARRFRGQLDQIGRHASFKMTRHAGDARNLAAQAVEEGFDRVVAAGGDGTLNEVVNGVGDAGGFERCALGVLPLGTVNVFARELCIPLNLPNAWDVVLKGCVVNIDLACAISGSGEDLQRRYFVQLAGAGLDARAIELVDWGLKKRIGSLAYVYAGLKALVGRRSLVQVQNGTDTLLGELVLIGNGRLYGGNFRTFEQAEMADGLLDVCVFPRVSLFTLLRCAGPLLLSGRLPNKGIRRFQANRFSLNSEQSTAFELEGELAGRLPVTFSVDPRRLRVIAP